MGAEFFRAVFAVQEFIGFFREIFRMAEEGDLPSEHQGKGQYQKAHRVWIPDKKQGCEHHRVIPVVNAAGAAAFVFQKPGMEGTEKEDADHVTDGVEAA